jgi:hypothetical protein
MGDEPSTSKDADDTQVETQPWTRVLKLLPPYTYNKLQKHLGLDSQQNSTGTKKDEKLGYRLFKEGCVSNVQAEPNIPNSASGKSFILKATVHASMKKLSYVVYVHLNQVNGDVVHGHCSCKAGKRGQCKHDGLSLVSCSQLSLIFPFVCSSVIFQMFIKILTVSYPRCETLLYAKHHDRQTINL